MPEYLAPGVYVEEVSFRSKSIEGVPTSTTGFVGLTRSGPVRFAGGRFVLARRCMTGWLGLPEAEEDFEVEPRAGDVFLGLTWSPHAIPLAHATLRGYADRGVRINFVVYDLLPQQHPAWFPFGLPQQHLGWLLSAAATAEVLP